ncbi:N-terminal acetyltransferase C complex catalytic subunit MAK3 [Plectosphaerella plurivora]|uniref:N-terminal acetyltransferase C complex catalytic subunit MAK3 n=1 Tax=Plectosphaerella plurivora TaxID=936078 RepID=A0A9P8V5N7_9PEZI|nr:N-terminal acetyltransferase C complex catalytic subunit MAK3 [Plectosphaerella plurivora]
MPMHASAINVVQYDHTMEEKYLAAMRSLITDGLSEPYSIYVYRYFLCQWAHLCYMALDSSDGTLIGAVICKLEMHSSHSPSTRRGYIAMLAVDSPHRGKGIATTLVKRAIDAMVSRDADEIVLETEETNTSAMRLYERLGFFRSKKLHRYYLNGNSAYRLVLLTKPISPDSLVDEPHEDLLERNTTAIR